MTQICRVFKWSKNPSEKAAEKKKVLKTIGFQHFFLFHLLLGRDFRPLEYSANLSHSRGVVMARISMRNVQKSPVSEYFDLFLSSAAARGVKDKGEY